MISSTGKQADSLAQKLLPLVGILQVFGAFSREIRKTSARQGDGGHVVGMVA